MSFPRYPTYKDSGVDWLGEVPAHWEVCALKRGYNVALGKMLQPESSSECDELLPYLRAANIHWSGVETTDIKQMWFSKRDQAQLRLEIGDLLISEGGDVGRSCLWKSELDECYFQNSVNRVRAHDGHSNRYLYYWMSVIKDKGYIDVLCNKSTIAHFTAEKVSAVFVPFPTPAEQSRIATFLDRETAKIDELIAEQLHMTELLKEKRQAVISHTITKGLDPEAPTKSSGIAWPDLVPAHWEVLPLTRVVRQFVDYRGVTPEKLDEGIIPLITATQIKNGRIDHALDPVFISEAEYKKRMTRGFPEKGDVLLTTEAPLGETAQIEDERVSPGQRMILMKVESTKITNAYLYTHFRSAFGHKELWTRASGSTASGIRADRLRASIVLVPPLDEQEKIVKHIERQISQLPLVEEECRKQIELLQERRAALISAAVTGQIDVRQLTVNHTP